MGSGTAQRAVVDTTARSDQPTMNIGGASVLGVRDGASTWITYLQAPSPAPLGSTVVSAKLRVFQQGTASTGARTLTLRRIIESWRESTLTWKNRPARTGTASASQSVPGAGAESRMVEFDVTADVQKFTDGTTANYGWTLESTGGNTIILFSSESTLYPPHLAVEWSDAPQVPTDMVPSGNAIVAASKPVLRWSFVDLTGDTTLGGIQVHLKTANTGWSAAGGYSPPTFDSGILTSTQPQLDLATTSYGGLGAGASAWWTVRNRDGAGLWSTWSDPQQFTYRPPQAVTLTSPGVNVTDTTFPWAWTAATQSRFQLQVRDTAGTVLWDSGQVTSTTARDFTQPRGIIRTPGIEYVAVLRVWDGYDRVSTPGAPAAVEVSRTFTYTDTDTVGPVTSLASTQLADRPGVRLTWNRSSMPDQFSIWVDGDMQAAVDGPDLSTGGSAFGYDLILPPRSSHAVVVKAIRTDGGVTKSSTANPDLVVRSTALGVWLIDPASPTQPVRMLQDGTSDIVSTTMPEATERFDPVGSSTSVAVTSALRWFAGTVTDGVLADYGATTAAQLRARMLRMKGNRTRRLLMVWGRRTVPVYIDSVDISEVDIPGAERYLVSFNFIAAVASPEYTLS